MSAQTSEVLIEFAALLAELAVLLVAVASLLALLARRVGVARLQRWLSGGRIQSALKGILLGFFTPFCTYSAIPMLVGMIQARLRGATVAGFLLAAPVLDPIVIVVLVILFGWQATIAYAAVTFVVVLLIAVLADAWSLERHIRPIRVQGGSGSAPADTCSTLSGSASTGPGCAPSSLDPFTDPTSWQGWRAEAESSLRYALNLARGLAIPMVIAVAFAALIIGFVPQDLVRQFAGPENPVAIPVAALLGTPFYVSTVAFLPIAAALHDSGMGLGAVFALVIAAAGVNLPELALLSRVMTRRLLVVYTFAVVGIAITAGYLIPLML